jgi:hypothetical protein
LAPLSDAACNSITQYGSLPEPEKESIDGASRREMNDKKYDQQHADPSDPEAQKTYDEPLLRHTGLSTIAVLDIAFPYVGATTYTQRPR